MKRIKNKQRFSLGLITNILSITCFIIAFFDADNTRFIVSAILLLAFAVVNYYYAFRQCGPVEEIIGTISDRDRIIAMEGCQKTVQILNYVLLGATLLNLILYGAFKLPVFLVIAITLCSVLVLMFVIILVINTKLEKQNKTKELSHS